MEIILLAPQVPVIPDFEEAAWCAACAITAPRSDMTFRDHYGGFWLCTDKIRCELRTHLAICPIVNTMAGHGNRFCQFCMAGTRLRPGHIIRDGRKYGLPRF